MQHLDEGQIHAWLDGALSGEESADVERHVAQCEACASLVAEARGMMAGATRIVSSLDIVRGGVIPKSTRTAAGGSLWRSLRFTPARAALAATLLIAVSTLLTVRHDTVDKLVPAQAEIAASPVASPATDAVAPAPAAPAPAPAASVVVSGAASTTTQPSKVSRQEQSKPASVEPPRRVVAGARDQAADSAPPRTSAKTAIAEESQRNAVAAQRVVAAAPPSVPQVAGGAASGAATADAFRPLAKANKDSTRFIASGDSLRRASVTPAAQGFASSRLDVAQRMSEAAASAFNRSDPMVVGCYQLTADSSGNSTAIAERFALEPARGDSTRNVVHAVMPDGRVDGAIASGYWVRRSPNLVDVRFSGDSLQSLLIRLPVGSNPSVASITGVSRTRSVFISRLVCRR